MNKRELCEQVREFFIEISKDMNICQIPNCRSEPFKGGILNLKKHLLLKHPETAKGIGLSSKNVIARRIINDEAEESSIKKIKLTIDVNKIYRGVVKFVAGKSVSFRAIEDEGFKEITEDLFQAVEISVNN